MAEYIERKKLEEAFDNADPDVCESDMDGHSDWGFGRENVRDVIRGVPAADVAQVVHGRWGTCRVNLETGNYEEQCTRCRNFSKEYGKPYCPNCGEKMEGGAANASD